MALQPSFPTGPGLARDLLFPAQVGNTRLAVGEERVSPRLLDHALQFQVSGGTSKALEHRAKKVESTFEIRSDAFFFDERIVDCGKPGPFFATAALRVRTMR
ncbi:hypothetical protein [Microvirga sp. G4-2]|uniref:hypothetical protein n=1 Tax=Microvirga sp. G4-2 TaxID=3434467 RepID=UPI0040443CED